jgi:hypothetical protein
MKYKNLYIDTAYLLLLGMTLGAVLFLGIGVTAVVFHTEYLLATPLSHYDEGLIMSEIFRRFSYWSYFMAFFIIVYESFEYKSMKRDKIAGLSAFIAIFTLLMFSGVYVPKILQMQEEGEKATQSSAFEAVHMGSEIDFKILAVALIVLFVRRLMLLRTIKPNSKLTNV